MVKLANSHLSPTINQASRYISDGNSTSRIAFSVSFGIRQPDKLPRNTEGYIYMWLNYGRKRLAFSTGIKAIPKRFNSKTGEVEGEPEKTMALATMKHNAEKYAYELKVTERTIDLPLIKAVVLNTFIESIPLLVECVRLFNLRVINQLYETGDLEKGSYDKLQGWNKHIESWVSKKLSSKARIDELVPADANHFFFWLRNKCFLSHNVAVRIVAHLKRILNYAVENEWIMRNPFMNYRKKLEKKKLDYLTEQEMEVLETAKFASQALDQLRDVFLFQCYTSLSYNELRDLTPSHIAYVDGYAYIRIARKKTSGKTGIDQIIPLVPQAILLLQQYQEHEICKRYDRCFPVQSNQKFNALLKQIAMVTGIKKRLTSHVGRRTAATHYLKQGVPLVSVSAMLGHSNTQVTQNHYTHVQPEMVVRDFKPFLKVGS
ncbi:site-specific integrase [Telluribacter sp. SYSU D00476]|uniref:tyrosine-type recombinase/integrase n=1 Tax=Telluribacter sp. SYSU D00476 TaxID=2811430 RepID=UPI001FF6B7E0|nr:site-specific integrase [Telluribacter sp. SYSU D00476]